jgi:DNA-binding CsgD family transcriptional regulator
VAVALSFAGRDTDVAATLAAGAILAVPLTVAAARSWETWRVVARNPAILLLVGPLTVIVGIFGDRSAFYYPELLWVAAAAIAGGMRWALGAILIFTLGTTTAGILTGELDAHAAITEAVLVIGPRVILAVLMAGLFEGLAEIVWLRAAETTPSAEMQLPAAAPDAEIAAGAIDREPPRGDEDAEEVLDAVVIAGELAPAHNASVRIAPAASAMRHASRLRKPLTDLERAVLEVVADGMTVAQAAQELGLNARTARARIERALSRNQLHSTPALIRWAFENGHLLPREAEDSSPGGPAQSPRWPSPTPASRQVE